MGFFSEERSDFDELIERATPNTSETENWAYIMDIVDRIAAAKSTEASRQCLLAIKKRMNNRDQHVVAFALSVLDACVVNGGTTFRQTVCSRDFIQELKSKATCSIPSVAGRTRQLIRKWADDEFSRDPSLSLMGSLLKELKMDGYAFDTPPEKKKNTKAKMTTNPNYVNSKEEEDAIAKAIAESLKSAPPSQTSSGPSSSYPNASSVPHKEARLVKAMYDFEAAEENELTFKAGDYLEITDDTDINWWKGTHKGKTVEGLFPASFVTANLSTNIVTSNDASDFSNSQAGSTADMHAAMPIKIDENILDQCLTMLQDADPTGIESDQPELLQLEEQSKAQGPLIDAELAQIDQKHNALAEVDVKLRDALALYDSAMQQSAKLIRSTVQPPPMMMPIQMQQPIYDPNMMQSMAFNPSTMQQYDAQYLAQSPALMQQQSMPQQYQSVHAQPYQQPANMYSQVPYNPPTSQQ